jgi:hypothetical protein
MLLIVSYSIGDGYTFSSELVVPVMAESKEAFMDAFDTAMAAYEPGGKECFSMFGQTFEYRHFIHWSEEWLTKRRVRETYDSVPPTVQSVDEWISSSLAESERLANEKPTNVFVVPFADSLSRIQKV